MNLVFTKNAWEDYTSWLVNDKKMLKKVNQLLQDIHKTPYKGLGKPEPLKYDLSGLWSRRIDREHRLIYQVREDEIRIIKCRFHYD